jgi:uncharacterized protein (DUF305 family)
MPKPSRILAVSLAVAAGACSGGAVPVPTSTPRPAPGGPRIVQPGAPGQASRVYAIEEIDAVEGLAWTDADVRFLQGMIPHHAQALEMTALVRLHATTDAVRQMGLRMEISQRDEIGLMESWLREHGQPVQPSGMHAMHGGHTMPGMLTPEQLATLSNARGVDFDRLFLQYMIQHHEGAITMVRELFASSGAAQESTIFKFAEDVDADQTMEIERMQGILARLR